MERIGAPDNRVLLGADALRRAVAHFGAFRGGAVDLHKLREVDRACEGTSSLKTGSYR